MIEITVESVTEEVELHTGEITEKPIYDYHKLINKPTLDGVVIEGDVRERDPTVPTWAKADKKPDYSAPEVGAVPDESAITLEEINMIFNGI